MIKILILIIFIILLNLKQKKESFSSDYNINKLKKIFGEKLHLHFGLYKNQNVSIDQAGDDAIRLFYPFIPDKSKIIDLGSGFGATAELLHNEKKCKLSLVNNNSEEINYIKSKNIGYIYDMDLNNININESFDIGLMIESLSSIFDKEKLIKYLSQICNKLIIRVISSRKKSKIDNNSNTYLVPVSDIINILEKYGFKIIYLSEFKKKKATIMNWNNNLINNKFQHEKTSKLRNICNLLFYRTSFFNSFPIFDIVATKL